MTFTVNRWRLLAWLLFSAASSAQQSLPIEPQQLAQHTERYQQTQLAIQQQRLDNELARLRVEHQQLLLTIEQAETAEQSSADTVQAKPQWLSRVEFDADRVSYVYQPSHWRWQ